MSCERRSWHWHTTYVHNLPVFALANATYQKCSSNHNPCKITWNAEQKTAVAHSVHTFFIILFISAQRKKFSPDLGHYWHVQLTDARQASGCRGDDHMSHGLRPASSNFSPPPSPPLLQFQSLHCNVWNQGNVAMRIGMRIPYAMN